MNTKPRESRRKRVLNKLSRPFKSLIRSRSQSVERAATGQAQGSGSVVGLPDCPSSTPPELPKESGQIGEALVLTLSVPELSAIRPPSVAIDPTTDLSSEPSTSQATPSAATEPSSAVSAPLTPAFSHGLVEPSSAAQTVKVVVKGALGILSSAADGIPIPGVKAIFDTIIKVIGIIEVRNVLSLAAKIG